MMDLKGRGEFAITAFLYSLYIFQVQPQAQDPRSRSAAVILLVDVDLESRLCFKRCTSPSHSQAPIRCSCERFPFIKNKACDPKEFNSIRISYHHAGPTVFAITLLQN